MTPNPRGSSRVISTGYVARPQFAPLHRRGKRWGVCVAHVRAGKTVACINDLIDAALRCQLPNPRFAYMAPYFSQAKDVAWAYLKQYTEAIPGREVNESELRVDLPGGRRVRLYGADNYQRLAGIYLDGVVIDEFGDMDPRAWKEVVRSRLADRNGWAMFIGTPRGMNHFAEVWERAQLDPEWYTLSLKASETRLLPQSELDSARKQMSEEDYNAQYECSFAASVHGSYFGRQLAAAEQQGRVCEVPYRPELPVHTWWDIGYSDATAVWFTQDVGREVHVIDYLEESGEPFSSYARLLLAKPYIYGSHNAPHDAFNTEISIGKSRAEVMAGFGIRWERVPQVEFPDGIDTARSFLARCWFDRQRTEDGRLALASYHKKYDQKRETFLARAEHDWSSHGADAFRYLAVGHKTTVVKPRPKPVEIIRTSTDSAGGTAWMGS